MTVSSCFRKVVIEICRGVSAECAIRYTKAEDLCGLAIRSDRADLKVVDQKFFIHITSNQSGVTRSSSTGK